MKKKKKIISTGHLSTKLLRIYIVNVNEQIKKTLSFIVMICMPTNTYLIDLKKLYPEKNQYQYSTNSFEILKSISALYKLRKYMVWQQVKRKVNLEKTYFTWNSNNYSNRVRFATLYTLVALKPKILNFFEKESYFWVISITTFSLYCFIVKEVKENFFPVGDKI